MFHTIERELEWRRENGKPEGFDALRACKPTVAVGASRPLEDEMRMADYFHGRDGLGDIHFSHPHLTPEQTWESLFFPSTKNGTAADTAEVALDPSHPSLFITSKKPAHQEILRILKENDPETVTIVAVGPLTNLALAAAEDPETFLRAKEVVVMGGAIDIPGNVTPTAEFNAYADAAAAARVFALTSLRPASTMPPTNPSLTTHQLPAYPAQLSKQLTLKLFPLDITHQHTLTRGQFRAKIAPMTTAGSPLAEWLSIILGHSFATLDALHPGHDGDKAALSLHDPLCVWYALTNEVSPTQQQSGWQPSAGSPEDIRVETTGQWTRGMCVVDRRNRKRRDDDLVSISDNGHWLSNLSGNRVQRMVSSPDAEVFGGDMLDRIFG
ncbi:DNA glycosylase [[Emmonsia] crescens]|uniref:DNA glycosylase n=1 Tax=[Emmonsia] crescens TaxID=73230 RepID=A0A0G2I113_9EURO|nr:DNA glycosylase [Emmonsia crescens UAMH 3008]